MLDYSLNDMAYPEDNLDSILKNNPLSPQLVEKITNIDGVTEVKTRNILALRIKSDNAEKAGRLMSLSVLDRKDFDKLNHRSVSIGDIDYDTAVKRKAIFYGWSRFFNDSGYELNQMLNINLISAKQSIDFPCPLIGSFGSLDTDWAITEDTFKELNITDNTTGAIWVDCSKKDITEVRSKLHNLLSDITHIEITEYQDAFKITQYSSYIMKIGIYSFLAIIGFIGFLNMANTMITSIITRKKEYGVLQAIGMTNTQLNHMLQTEGFIFTLGTILIALVVGMPAGYMMFIYGKKNSIFSLNIYHIPFVEVGIMITVIALLQIILSYFLSRNIKKESLVERIRYYE
jgi:putative ABC transport system permease protein